ncbi:hypothetical protein D3C78_1466500 [compost metagenome]
MIGQRHRGVADARREQLHQPGGNRAVDHGHVDHQDGQKEQYHRVVGLGRVGFFGVSRVLERASEGRDEGIVLNLEVGSRHAGALEALQHLVANADLSDGAWFGLFVLVGYGPFGQHAFG